MTLHLRESTIHEQFYSRDVAAVVRRQKHHGFGSLIGRSGTFRAERRPRIISFRVSRLPLKKPANHALRACRLSLGSLRLLEYDDPLSPLSKSARTNARRLSWRYRRYT